MNVIIYWKNTDGYAGVYDVDQVRRPTERNPDLRLFKRIDDDNVEVARFEGAEIRGWQVFLTWDDARRADADADARRPCDEESSERWGG